MVWCSICSRTPAIRAPRTARPGAGPHPVPTGGRETKTRIGIITALLLGLAVGGASAQELQGTVRRVDATERAFTLEDGTRVWVAEGLSMSAVREGAAVRAAYEERDGKKIATTLEVAE